MSGLREAILENEPILYYTFDGENYVGEGYLSDESPRKFDDAMGHKDAILVDTQMDCPWHGYRVRPSLCEIETNGNAMSFGYDGYYNVKDDNGKLLNWYAPNSYMEIPHSEYTVFPHNQMCIELLFRINYMQGAQFGNGTTYGWVFSKSGLISATIVSAMQRYYLDISTAAGEKVTVDVSQNRTYHLVVNYSAAGGLEVYLDCIDIADHSLNLPENQHGRLRTLNVAAPFFFGSKPGNLRELRKTEAVTLDYVAIYDYTLPEAEIVRHHKKIRTYAGTCIHHGCRNILSLDDNFTPDHRLKEYGRTDAAAHHNPNCQLRVPGPEAIPQAYGIRNTNKNPLFWGELNVKFMPGTLEFWFMLGASSKSQCIFHTDGHDFPSRGLQIWAHSQNGNYKRGTLEFILGDGFTFNTASAFGDRNWCDGEWHHLCVVIAEDRLRVFIDMIEYEYVVSSKDYPAFGSYRWCFGSSRNTGYSDVAISNLAIYHRALSRLQINTHYTYGIINRIRGIITLQGIPIAATIRAYNHITGRLEYETDSDPVTGEYEMSLLDNSRIDLMVFDKANENIRYRAVGPIEPDKYIDIPFLL